MDPLNQLTIADIVAAIPSGTKLALPTHYAGVSMAATRELLRSSTRNLHLVCVPTAGMQADLLIGAGLVQTVETSAVSLAEAGGAPCFNRAVCGGKVKIMDATCPALIAGLTAAQKGAPFAAIRGIIGSDVLASRPDCRVIDNPFAQDDPVVLVPALRPDVALFHAAKADRLGNVWIGRLRELATMAYASHATYVTVEEIVDEDLLGNEELSAGVLPALYVSGVAVAPRGAWPYPLQGCYRGDPKEVFAYAEAAKTPEGFAAYVEQSNENKVTA